MMKYSAALLLIVFSIGYMARAAAPGLSKAEQTQFSAEDEGVKLPVVMPDDVRRLLDKDDNLSDELKSNEPPLTHAPSSWFSTSEIHLAGPEEKDLVVMAIGELRGANVTRFWIFRPTLSGHELIFYAPVHSLIVKRTRAKGYREIELFSATAIEWSTVTLRFDGKKYVQYRERSGQNGR